MSVLLEEARRSDGMPVKQAASPLPNRVATKNVNSPIMKGIEDITKNVFKDEVTKLDIDFTGPLESFAGNCAVKRFAPSVANNIFKIKGFTASTVNGVEQKQPIDITKVIIKKIKVSHTQNTFPFALAFDMEESGIPSSCHTIDGLPCSFVVRSGEQGERAVYQEVHSATAATDDNFLKRYAHVNPDKLRNGITRVPGEPFSLIKNDHEIMKILRMPENEAHQGYKAADFKVVGNSYAVPNELCDRAFDGLNQSILKHLKFHDLTKFSVRMRRTDGGSFNDLGGTTKASFTSASDRNLALKEISTAACQLEIHWCYPCQEQNTSASSASDSSRIQAKAD